MHRKSGWDLWFWWVVASTFGWLLGGTVGMLAGQTIGAAVGWIMGAFIGAIIGGGLGGWTFTGVTQWLVLREKWPGAGWWVAATSLGWVAVTAFAWLEGVLNESIWIILAAGATVGLAQWLALRQQAAGSGWWIAASAVGWAIPFAWFLAPALLAEEPSQPLAISILLGLVPGVCVGLLSLLVLQLQSRPTAGEMLLHLAGWTAGMIISAAVAVASQTLEAWELGILIRVGLSGTVYGAITGAALAFLAPSRPRIQPPRNPGSRPAAGLPRG